MTFGAAVRRSNPLSYGRLLRCLPSKLQAAPRWMIPELSLASIARKTVMPTKCATETMQNAIWFEGTRQRATRRGR